MPPTTLVSSGTHIHGWSSVDHVRRLCRVRMFRPSCRSLSDYEPKTARRSSKRSSDRERCAAGLIGRVIVGGLTTFHQIVPDFVYAGL